MYISPKVVVSAAAVAAEIAPPINVPTPGMSFSGTPTIARPVRAETAHASAVATMLPAATASHVLWMTPVVRRWI